MKRAETKRRTSRRGRPERTETEIAAFRARVVRVAERIIEREGYAATSMRRLAEETGCTPNTLYAYFASKSDILGAIWARFFRELFDELTKRGAATEDPLARLHLLARGYVGYWLQHPDRYRMVFMTEGVSQEEVGGFLGNSDTLARFALLWEAVHHVLGMDRAPEDVKARAEALLAALHGIIQHHVTVSAYPWTAADVVVALAVNALCRAG